jgi:hypothetical protein
VFETVLETAITYFVIRIAHSSELLSEELTFPGVDGLQSWPLGRELD